MMRNRNAKRDVNAKMMDTMGRRLVESKYDVGIKATGKIEADKTEAAEADYEKAFYENAIFEDAILEEEILEDEALEDAPFTKMEEAVIGLIANDVFGTLKEEYILEGEIETFNTYMEIFRTLYKDEQGMAVTLIDLILGEHCYDDQCQYMRTVCRDNQAAVKRLADEINSLIIAYFVEELFKDEDDEDEWEYEGFEAGEYDE